MAIEPHQLDLSNQARQPAAEAARLAAVLTALTFTGHDDARLVQITVDGTGRAVEARAKEWAWENLEPAALGRHIVAALRQARALAACGVAAVPITESARCLLGIELSDDVLAGLDAGLVTTAADGRSLVGTGSDDNDIVRVRVTRHGLRAVKVDSGRASRLTAGELAWILAAAESRANSALGRQIAERSGFLPARGGGSDEPL